MDYIQQRNGMSQPLSKAFREIIRNVLFSLKNRSREDSNIHRPIGDI